MLKPQQPSSSGRKTSNGTSGSSTMSSAASGINTSNRTTVGRSRSVKPPFQSPPVFEGVYNNARMLHFLTAVVGSTCDVRVKNGTVYEGIFKTLSARCELAVDAVHRCDDENSTAPPRREEITDTMIFSPNDLVTMTCKDVDLNYATRDTFTDTAISSGRVNGEHKEKVLQRWEGGDSNGESYDLETDASNGWDANEMFRFNEENYGVKSTYDSSLAMYTVPLERGTSENFRQREARAARLASEIESSPQYRHRVALENDEGKTEEDKFSAVVRDAGGAERERGRESPRDRDRERGRDSPSGGSREGKYIPLPQRAREMGNSGGGLRGERGGERSDRGGRGGGYHPSRSTPPSSSPRPPLPPASQPASTPSERNSPLSSRGGYTPGSPPSTHTHSHSPHSTVPHSHSLPHGLSDAGRPVNGVPSRTSPKSQRPHQPNRPVRPSNTHTPSTASRSPKSDTPSQDSSLPSTPYMDSSPVSMAKQKPTGPAPLFPVDVNEILSSAVKERAADAAASPDDGKSSKAPSAQQRSQIEELRKFGKEFRLQPSTGNPSSPGAAVTASATASPAAPVEGPQPGPTKASPSAAEPPGPPAATAEVKPSLAQSAAGQPPASPAEDAPQKDKEAPAPAAAATTTPAAASLPVLDRQSPATPQPARTPGPEEGRAETAVEAVTDQVKRSTLNPNAKEFNPIKPPIALSKPSSAPTPPRPTPPSPSVVLQHPAGQGTVYSAAPYLSYVSQIHPVQAQQMYQYSMPAVNQGKYPRAKGSVVAQRSDHNSSAPPMLQAASAAGAPLVASPYPQSYLQYNPPQYGQQQVIQTMSPYPGQPMYPMLQGGARMLGSGGGHPQALGPPGGPQFPGQNEGPQGPQQGIYAPQSFSHHSGSVHPPQPSSTPTGSQPPPQHTTPSPGQTAQSGPQPQSLYHSGPLSAPTPPNMPPGHSSPQAQYPLQGYSLHGHQGIPHTYTSLGQIAQAHVQGPMSGPHPSGTHGPPQMVMLHAPPQAGPGSAQHPQHGPQQGPPQHFTYIGHQAVPVQTHQQIPFHPPSN